MFKAERSKSLPRTLFVGWGGTGGVTWYRSILPARTLNTDYVVFGTNGKEIVRDCVTTDHELIVVQSCWYEWQRKLVRNMQKDGARVVFNVDDWIAGIGRLDGSHSFSEFFKSSKVVEAHLRLLDAADGLLVSTEWLQRRLSGFNSNTEIARNLLDGDRYNVPEVERDAGCLIGWAGGTGHTEAVLSLREPLQSVLAEHKNTMFVCMGDDSAINGLGLEREQVAYIPWSDHYLYPRDMACFDVSLAPALDNDFYRAKSQLRFYEGASLGIPMVASPLYSEIKHGLTGFIADSADEWAKYIDRLLDDDGLRAAMGERAREWAMDNVWAGSRRDYEWESALLNLYDNAGSRRPTFHGMTTAKYKF